jgi:hypothetical protein
MAEIAITPARRRRVPFIGSLSSVSGGGKTYSALLLAAGLAGRGKGKKGGKIGFLDTENGRGLMYADDPDIIEALGAREDGYADYDYAELREPFAPGRYTEHIQAFEKFGIEVLVIDSVSHEWEGSGGCTEIAENNKLGGLPNWARAKREHKRMMNYVLASQMHIIFCVRAREKTAILKDEKGKEHFVPQGIVPVTEKNFIYEMTLSLSLEEGTHRPLVTKCPAPLRALFSGAEPLVTKAMGEKLRVWVESGSAGATVASGARIAEQVAEYWKQGADSFVEFFAGLTADDRDLAFPKLSKEQKTMIRFDQLRAEMESAGIPQKFHDILGAHGFERIGEITPAKYAAVGEEMKTAIADCQKVA